jgi:hypothetical protein
MMVTPVAIAAFPHPDSTHARPATHKSTVQTTHVIICTYSCYFASKQSLSLQLPTSSPIITYIWPAVDHRVHPLSQQSLVNVHPLSQQSLVNGVHRLLQASTLTSSLAGASSSEGNGKISLSKGKSKALHKKKGPQEPFGKGKGLPPRGKERFPRGYLPRARYACTNTIARSKFIKGLQWLCESSVNAILL